MKLLKKAIFTEREKEIAQLLMGSMNTQEIADKLKITPGCVSYHCSNIYKKLNLRGRGSRYELMRKEWSLTHEGGI